MSGFKMPNLGLPNFVTPSVAKNRFLEQISKKVGSLVGHDSEKLKKLESLACSKNSDACSTKAHCAAITDAKTWTQSMGLVAPEIRKCRADPEKLMQLISDIHTQWKDQKWGYPKNFVEERSIDGFLVDLLDKDTTRRLRLGLYPPKIYHDILVWRASGVLEDHVAVALVYFMAPTTFRNKVVMDMRVVDETMARIVSAQSHMAVAVMTEQLTKEVQGIYWELRQDPRAAKIVAPVRNTAKKAAGGFGDLKKHLSVVFMGVAVLGMAAPAMAAPPVMHDDPMSDLDFYIRPPKSALAASEGGALASGHYQEPWADTYGKMAVQAMEHTANAVQGMAKQAYETGEFVVDGVAFTTTYIADSIIVTLKSPMKVYLNQFHGKASASLSTHLKVFEKSCKRLSDKYDELSPNATPEERKHVARTNLRAKLADIMPNFKEARETTSEKDALEALVMQSLGVLPMASLNSEAGPTDQYVMERMLDGMFGGTGLMAPGWKKVTGLDGKEAREMLVEEIKKSMKIHSVHEPSNLRSIINRVADKPQAVKLEGNELREFAYALSELTQAGTREDVRFEEEVIWDITNAHMENLGLDADKSETARADYFNFVKQRLNDALNERKDQTTVSQRAESFKKLMENLIKAEKDAEAAIVRAEQKRKEAEDELQRLKEAKEKADREAAEAAAKVKQAREEEERARKQKEEEEKTAAEFEETIQNWQAKLRNAQSKSSNLAQAKKSNSDLESEYNEALKKEAQAREGLRQAREGKTNVNIAMNQTLKQYSFAKQNVFKAERLYDLSMKTLDSTAVNASNVELKVDIAKDNVKYAKKDLEAARAARVATEKMDQEEHFKGREFKASPDHSAPLHTESSAGATYVAEFFEDNPWAAKTAVGMGVMAIIAFFIAVKKEITNLKKKKYSDISVDKPLKIYCPIYIIIRIGDHKKGQLVYTYPEGMFSGPHKYFPCYVNNERNNILRGEGPGENFDLEGGKDLQFLGTTHLTRPIVIANAQGKILSKSSE